MTQNTTQLCLKTKHVHFEYKCDQILDNDLNIMEGALRGHGYTGYYQLVQQKTKKQKGDCIYGNYSNEEPLHVYGTLGVAAWTSTSCVLLRLNFSSYKRCARQGGNEAECQFQRGSSPDVCCWVVVWLVRTRTQQIIRTGGKYKLPTSFLLAVVSLVVLGCWTGKSKWLYWQPVVATNVCCLSPLTLDVNPYP